MAGSGASTSTGPEACHWEFAALTDTGRVRRNNEDAVAVDAATGLAIVADGMGGYNGGEVASGMAVALLRAGLGRWLGRAGPAAPARALRRAMDESLAETNDAILDAGNTNPQLQGMGTTLVMGAFGPRRVMVAHIGDSRCYRLRDGELRALTRDHSLLQEHLDAGLLTPEEAARFPHRNLVTRALGIERGAEPEIHLHDARPGDLYLLCSDGLHEMVGDAQILTVLLQKTDIQEKATLLVSVSNDNGGRDNVSVVLAKACDGTR